MYHVGRIVNKSLLVGLTVSSASIFTASTQPVLQFALTSYIVAESSGSVTLGVLRTGDTNTVVSVDYATADGSATNGIKYTAVSNTLTFDAGVTLGSIVVPILNEGGRKNGQSIGVRDFPCASFTARLFRLQFRLGALGPSVADRDQANFRALLCRLFRQLHKRLSIVR